jgi:hypothetical protein
MRGACLVVVLLSCDSTQDDGGGDPYEKCPTRSEMGKRVEQAGGDAGGVGGAGGFYPETCPSKNYAVTPGVDEAVDGPRYDPVTDTCCYMVIGMVP